LLDESNIEEVRPNSLHSQKVKVFVHNKLIYTHRNCTWIRNIY